jgi:hypothetical protein
MNLRKLQVYSSYLKLWPSSHLGKIFLINTYKVLSQHFEPRPREASPLKDYEPISMGNVLGNHLFGAIRFLTKYLKVLKINGKLFC